MGSTWSDGTQVADLLRCLSTAFSMLMTLRACFGSDKETSPTYPIVYDGFNDGWFHGKSQSNMDDDQGTPTLGHPQMIAWSGYLLALTVLAPHFSFVPDVKFMAVPLQPHATPSIPSSKLKTTMENPPRGYHVPSCFPLFPVIFQSFFRHVPIIFP